MLERLFHQEEGLVKPMRMSWEAETDRLRCQWSEAGRYVQYNPGWMQETPGRTDRGDAPPLFLVFTNRSPFGGGEWYLPRCLRLARP